MADANTANPDQCRLCGLERAIDKSAKRRKPIPKEAHSYQIEVLTVKEKNCLFLKELLSDGGVKFFLPEKLNQDRLEVLFSKLRQSLGDSDNPTVEEARHRITALLVSGRHIMAPPQHQLCSQQRGRC